MSSQDVIVLGAGIVGKAASLALSKQGLRVLHIAPNLGASSSYSSQNLDETTWDSRIYALSSSSQKLLADLQAWDAMNGSRIQAVRDMRVFGDSGQKEDRLHFSAFQGTVPQLAWIVESGNIENGLDMAIRFQTGITRIEDRVIEFTSTSAGVSVKTSNGQTFEAKLLIAADGANSPVRQQLEIETSIDHYEQTAVVANFHCSQTHLQTAFQWFLPTGDILALLPLPNQKVSMVWSTSPGYASELSALSQESPEKFCRTIEQAANGLPLAHLGALKQITSAQSFPLRRIWAKRVIGPNAHPNILLVGDAAHAMHPLAGQGLNLGLRDIAVLNELLQEKETFRELDDRIFLRRYERNRQGDIQSLLTTTHHLQKMFSSERENTKSIRNFGMRLINRSPFIKRQLIQKALG